MTNLSDLFPAGAGKQVSFVADGAVSAAGKPVVLNSAGTISQVSETTVSADIPIGSTIYTADSSHEVANNSSAIDISSGKVVVVARDGSSSSYMSVYVGTINTSNGYIGWGSRYHLTSSSTQYPMIVADPHATNKFIISYQVSSQMRVAILTVSGTTPSLNSSDVSFGDTNGEYPMIAADPNTAGSFVCVYQEMDSSTRHTLATAFTYSGSTITVGTEKEINTIEIDTPKYGGVMFDQKTAGKFAIAWRDYASPHYLYFQAATISGTTITEGTAVVADSAACGWPRIAFDGNTAGKFAIAEAAANVGSNFTVICGNLSGTVPTFGTAVDLSTAGTVQEIQAFRSWPDLADNYVIVYKANSNKPYARNISTSGTVPSAATEAEITTNTMSGAQLSGCANPASKGGFIAVWTSNVGSNPLESMYSQAGYTSTNLSATALLGISDAAISDSASGNVTIKGGVATSGLSSLTPASDYYVQSDGTISTSSSGVKLGRALSSTSIDLEYQS